MSRKKKNPAAVALGRLGGLARTKSLTEGELSAIGKKGGQARKRKLSPARRSQLARQAVLARWRRQKGNKP